MKGRLEGIYKNGYEGIKESDEEIEEIPTFDPSVDEGPTFEPASPFDDDKDETNEYLYLEGIPREYEKKYFEEECIEERIFFDIGTKDGEKLPGYDKDRIILALEDAAARNTEIEHVNVYREISTKNGIYRAYPHPETAIEYQTKTIEATIKLVEKHNNILKYQRNNFGDYERVFLDQSKEYEIRK